MVGKYSVCLHSFEEVALPALCVVQSMAERVGADKVAEKGVHGVVKRTPVLMVIDEIGKMELFSHKFESEVRLLFDQPDVVILATVPVQSKHKSLLLVDQLISRKDVNLYEVSRNLIFYIIMLMYCTLYTYVRNMMCTSMCTHTTT